MLTCKLGHGTQSGNVANLLLPKASDTHQGGKAEHWVLSTSLAQHISDEMLLAIVCCEDGDLLRGITL